MLKKQRDKMMDADDAKTTVEVKTPTRDRIKRIAEKNGRCTYEHVITKALDRAKMD